MFRVFLVSDVYFVNCDGRWLDCLRARYLEMACWPFPFLCLQNLFALLQLIGTLIICFVCFVLGHWWLEVNSFQVYPYLVWQLLVLWQYWKFEKVQVMSQFMTFSFYL